MTAQGSDAELNPPPAPANPGAGVTREQVRHVAALASLELTAAEEESMERDLNAILGYIAELNELDTTQVEPMTQVSEILAARPEGLAHTAGLPMFGATGAASPGADGLREDVPRSSLARATVMAEAPATDGTFFKVPKVIER